MLTVLVAVLALVGGVLGWHARHRVDPALARPLVLPAQIGGLPRLRTPDTDGTSTELAASYHRKHPHQAFAQARYGGATSFPYLAVMMLRGSLTNEGDPRLARGPFTDIGRVRCGRLGGFTICYRLSDRLSVSVLFEGVHQPGAVPDFSATVAPWVAQVWDLEST